jgi:hypothetical protein
LLARNPQIALAPLLAAVAEILLFKLMPADGASGLLGAANASLTSLFAQLIDGFGLAVALIVAETAWRRGRAPFDDAWDEARRKAGDILMATIGFGFVVYVAELVGGLLPGAGPPIMFLIATFFFVYTLPAAAIGGVPGGAALQISLERSRRAVLATGLVTLLYLFVRLVAPSLIVYAISPLALQIDSPSAGTILSLIATIPKALLAGYLALVLAKTYDDASYGRFH